MSSFTQPLIVQKVKGRTWMVKRAFRYYIGKEGSDEYVDVPEGYLTDFASIPRIFWRIFPPDGQYSQASTVHDICYQEQLFSQSRCDDIFKGAMKVLNVPRWQRWLIREGLRIGGWYSYWRAGRILNRKK